MIFLMHCKKDDNKQPEIPQNSSGTAGLVDEPLWDPPSSAIHIDPTNISDALADGSIAHPFSSFAKVTWKDSMIVALKRGTTLESPSVIITSDKVVIASYGSGLRPIINSNTDGHAITTIWTGCSGITIRDIEVIATKASSCIIFHTNSTDVQILNCKLHGSTWGIRALTGLSNLKIYNTEVFDIKDDGMFIKVVDHIEIYNCYVHNVNTNWKPPTTSEELAGGDGIQFSDCNHWRVHHNLIDRTSSGNKFCFISNNANQNDGIFEYNVLKGPLVDGFSIYIGDGENLIVRYNQISAPSNSPIYTHSKNIKIYYNTFEGLTGPLFASNSAEVYNNLFYNMKSLAIQGGTIKAQNNIFDLGSAEYIRFKVTNLIEDHNLFVYGTATTGSTVGNPMYKDASKSDFHLQAGSDCIDKGINVGILKDMEGNIVPQGNAPDIGPFEFLP